MKQSHRLLAVILAVVMLVGILPLGIFAADAQPSGQTPVVVIAGSDFQDPKGDSAGAANVTAILEQIKKSHSSVDGMIFCGDYDKALPSKNVQSSINALQSAVTTTFSTSAAEIDWFMVQGNHDQVAQGTNGLTGPGAHDTDNYGVYIIDEDDYQWSSGANEEKIITTAAKLGAYLTGKALTKYDKPIFVASHVPLHFSPRTQEGDAKYGSYIFNVLQNAGKAGLNIIFLYGHDHSQGWDNYMGGSAVYLPVGHDINIATSGTTYTTTQLNFTYMNAGFVGYYADWEPDTDANNVDSGVDKTKTMTVFTITDDKVTIERYDANGVHNLKSEGKENVKHTSRTKCPLMTDVITGPQTIQLKAGTEVIVPPTEPEVTEYEDAATGISIKYTYGSDPSVALSSLSKTFGGIAKYKAYDITVKDFSGTAEVSIPVPAGYDASRVAVYYVLNGNIVENMKATVKNGKAVFQTTHFSTYMIAENESVTVNTWTKIEITGETTYTYTLDTDGINSGESYLIAAGGSANILYDNNGIARKSVTINNNTIVLDSDAYDWTITRMDNNASYRIQNGNRYLKIDNSHKLKINTQTDYSYWTLMSQDRGSYTFKAYSAGNYYIQYNNNNNTFSATTSSSSGANRLFRLTGTNTPSDIYHLGTDAENQTFTVGRFANKTELEAYLEEIIHVLRCEDDTTPTASSSVTAIDYTLSGPSTVNTTAAGTANYSVMVGDRTVGTFTVTFTERVVDEVRLNYYTGEVTRGAKNTAKTGATISVYYEDGGAPDVIDVTVGMLSGTGLDVQTVGVYENLTVTYNGMVLTNENNKFKLTVNPKPGENDYPEYPNQGAVRVNKTGTPISFKDTGVAEIELSAAGIPVHNGIDVIVMVDTSSSMNYGANSANSATTDGNQRINMLRNSLREMLRDFKKPNEDGTPSDIKVAIADFNGYTYSSFEGNTAASRNRVGGKNPGGQENNGKVFTGNKTLTAEAFIDVNTITVDPRTESTTIPSSRFDDFVSQIKTQSGTNFDYAFDAIYQLGSAIKAENAANQEERELYVIFMSDGCPFQYNYYCSNSETNAWNNWLNGTWDSFTQTDTNAHPYFYNGKGNSHRMADAIKGSADASYNVIIPASSGNIAYGQATGQTGMYTVPGLGATMYSIGFCVYTDKNIQATTVNNVISSIATDKAHYFNVQGDENDAEVQTELNEAFTQISNNIKLAAYATNFIDTMGSQYDLQMATKTGAGTEFEVNLGDFGVTPKIIVKTYDLYRTNEIDTTVNGKLVTAADVGTRKPGATVLETVTFNADGTEAYSSEIGEGMTNILDANGIINAVCFKYNTSTTETFTFEQTIILPRGGGTATQTIELPPESFCWNIGNLSDQEFVFSYYVYLTGSMEGTRPAGSYPTNEDATLHYKNWLDHDCELPTVSPVLSWASATVGFAYYLVDDNGDIIANRTTGQTGSFATRVTVADPVIEQILLNNLAGSTSTSGSTYLPFGYELYDPSAAFDIAIGSGENTSYWNITTGDGKKPTTYVTGYNGNDFTTSDSSALTGNVDYTHTTVWFAVRCTLGCIPDIVVVDYGRPVDISVLVNDMFGDYGTLAGIGAAMPDGIDSKTKMDALAEGFGKNALTLSYGSAFVNGPKVTFSFPEKNMNMTDAVTFAYAAKYENPEDNANDGYYYATVTVVPAATLYFEDDFVEYKGDWTTVGNALTSNQSEDRPGNIPMVDANNVYGYDPMNKDCITYSFGAAKKLTVSSANANLNGESYARFTFTGTAFDIISVTSKDTGTIVVLVEDSDGNKVAEYVVNTFYGYVAGDTVYHKYTWIHRDGAWYLKGNRVETATEDQYTAGDKALPTANIEDGKEYVVYDKMVEHSVTTDANNALYQIPVIKSEDFEYGTYTVTITPKYSALQDACHDGEYDFYLDAIRVYNPAGNDEEINNIYYQDNEGKPTYFEVRNNLIGETQAFKIDDRASGVVFIDKYGDIEIGSLPEYTFYGPNNEVYLKKGEGIAFAFDATDPTAIAAIHIGLKAVNSAVTVSINGKNVTLNTSTDMYYDLTAEVNFPDGQTTSQPVVILANGDGMLSVTNIKVTSKKATDAANNGVALTMDRDALALALDQIAIGHKPVATTVYGDFNVDGEINSRDLALLRKYFAGYDYTTGTSSFAIEGWNPTVRDLAKLRKYLSAYDYETGSSAYVLVPDEQ